MPRHRSLLPLAPVVLLLVALPIAARAQSEIQDWVSPTLGEAMPRADYKFEYAPGRHVHGQGTDFEVMEHSFSLFAPAYQDANNEWGISVAGRDSELRTAARLPDTHRRMPDNLWEASVGTSYRHRFENGWIGSGGVTFGSDSDQPFHSRDEMFVHALALVRIPFGERDAWLVSLVYASDNEFLGGVPVPGLAYQYAPSERLNAVIGVPFSSVEYKPFAPLALEAQYFPVRELRTRATYTVFRPLRVFGGFDLIVDHYFLADRRFTSERLFYYEKRVFAGARFDLRHVGFQVRGGWAFDRYYFTGNDYHDRRHDRVAVADGPFVAGGVAVRF